MENLSIESLKKTVAPKTDKVMIRLYFNAMRGGLFLDVRTVQH
jgi:hypothetical protein